MIQNKFRSSGRRRGQRGVGLVELALAMIIFSLVLLASFNMYSRYEDGRRAENQAGVLSLIRNAAETLLMEHYTDYQAGLAVTRNGVTLAFGDTEGELLAPTVAQLNQMAVGLQDAAETPFYKSLAEGGYQIRIRREPAGCEASPMGVECNISGQVCFDQALRDPGRPGEATDGFAVGRMLVKLGENGGASVNDADGSTIYGFGGAWELANPIAGSPTGIVCSRLGFGSAGFGNFLRVRDTRDPQFQNNVTVGGGVNIQRSAIMGAACTAEEEGLITGSVLDNGKQILIRCNGASFEPLTGITHVAAGSSCVNDGDFALDYNSGISLVCSSGNWVSQEGRGVQGLAYYTHGATVPQPTCPPLHQPAAVVAAVSASNIIGMNNLGNNTGSFQAAINAAWQVAITGADGASVAGNNALALIVTNCVHI